MLDLVRAWLFPAACLGCGVPRVALCPACLPLPAAALRFALGGLDVRAVAPYDGLWRRAIVAFKAGERDYAPVFARVLRERFEPRSAIVPVRTTRRRSALRGFDQAVELAAHVAGDRTIDALRKRPGRAQHGLGRSGRLALAGRFTVPRPELVAGRPIVLLDDVCTTGATLLDAARALRDAGARVEGAVVLAVAQRFEVRRVS